MRFRFRSVILAAAIVLASVLPAFAQSGVVSPANSSTAVLGSGAVFTGTADDVSIYSSVTVQFFANQATATNGLSLEFSTDGTTFDRKHQYTVAASTVFNLTLPVEARYFHVIETNSASIQTVHRLQAIYHVEPRVTAPDYAPDPCVVAGVVKSSAAVTATGQIVALAAGKVVYVCGFYATMGGTTPTLQFQYGTGAACGTGTVSLTGAFAPAPNGSEFFLGHGSSVMQTPVGNALCVTLAGTSPTIAGLLSYVQQ